MSHIHASIASSLFRSPAGQISHARLRENRVPRNTQNTSEIFKIIGASN